MKIQSNPDFLGKIDPEDPQLKDFLTEVEEEYGNARYIDRADKFDNDDSIFVDLDLENPKIQARINMLRQRVLRMLNLQNGSFQYWCEYHSDEDVSLSTEDHYFWSLPDESLGEAVVTFGDVKNVEVFKGVVDVPQKIVDMAYDSEREGILVDLARRSIEGGQLEKLCVPSGVFCTIEGVVVRYFCSGKPGYSHIMSIKKQ